jgi:hypothetical protein
MNPTFTKELLLGGTPRIEAVPLPECGENVVAYVRELSAAAVLGYSALHNETDDDTRRLAPLMAFMLRHALCDAGGKRLFADDESPLDNITWAVAHRIWQKALEVNKIADTDDSDASSKKSSAIIQVSPSRVA